MQLQSIDVVKLAKTGAVEKFLCVAKFSQGQWTAIKSFAMIESGSKRSTVDDLSYRLMRAYVEAWRDWMAHNGTPHREVVGATPPGDDMIAMGERMKQCRPDLFMRHACTTPESVHNSANV